MHTLLWLRLQSIAVSFRLLFVALFPLCRSARLGMYAGRLYISKCIVSVVVCMMRVHVSSHLCMRSVAIIAENSSKNSPRWNFVIVVVVISIFFFTLQFSNFHVTKNSIPYTHIHTHVHPSDWYTEKQFCEKEKSHEWKSQKRQMKQNQQR